ncbi:MAG: hydrogenase maturation nickel metallochaperone HypA [Bacteroidota bacterium]
MHELSIAQSIVETVKQNVPKEQLTNVLFVNVKVGEISGVIADSLEFSFSAIIAESELQNAKLVIQKIPFTLQCQDCNAIEQNKFGVSLCSSCASTNTKVISGNELQVVDIELEDVVS